jgi:hypothetical protein
MSEVRDVAFEFACYIAAQVPRGTPWTDVYDEMCLVARSRAFHGMGYAELSEAGVSLSITGLARMSQLLDRAWECLDNSRPLSPRKRVTDFRHHYAES